MVREKARVAAKQIYSHDGAGIVRDGLLQSRKIMVQGLKDDINEFEVQTVLVQWIVSGGPTHCWYDDLVSSLKLK